MSHEDTSEEEYTQSIVDRVIEPLVSLENKNNYSLGDYRSVGDQMIREGIDMSQWMVTPIPMAGTSTVTTFSILYRYDGSISAIIPHILSKKPVGNVHKFMSKYADVEFVF